MSAGRPQVVLATRELLPFHGPFGGGGIGAYVAETARALQPIADVTLLVADWLKPEHDALAAAGDPRLDHGGARILWVPVPEPDELGGFYAHMQLYAARVLEVLRAGFPDRGPDLVEFCDYLGEGFCTVEARRAGDPLLAETLIAVRLHTSVEICDVLNGHQTALFDPRLTRQIERRTLEQADVLLHGGGDVLGTYRRWYGDRLAPAVRVRHPLAAEPTDPGPAPDGPLRMLYVGRLERRKGVEDLVEAVAAIGGDWSLSLLGADTATGPRGASMRRVLERGVAGDGRIRFLDAVRREQLPQAMAEHDLLVLPSRWECWPYVALEGMLAGLPLVAPPVGGLTEMVVDGRTGWRVPATGEEALRATLEPLVLEPARARALRGGAALRDHVAALTDADAIRGEYERLLARPRAILGRVARPAGEPDPLVSIVIPYHRMHRFVTETVDSAFAQSYRRIEVLLIDDGSFGPDDGVLAELATRYPLTVLSQPNRGLAAARNFGIGQSRGRYVLPLDADNLLEPEFVARAVAILETEPDVHYVSSWNRYVDEHGAALPEPNVGYQPLGNWSPLVEERNVAGDGTAVLRRRLFDRFRYPPDLTSFEDWALYRLLHRAGLHGRVIPERLWRYRVREDSMLRTVGDVHETRLRAEMEAQIAEEEMTWTSTSA
ncbi:glycosyl transferase [Patulibacter medicamentivorans]|uniref:Glycosyl transferase n=1 Tax=Patulibacter medicamentivorans TaxID=1097667 RepID=H0E5S3_9ACTN|nr:glycosyltransferase [Patulibacter medicamentivorans]EHN10974.1 glycosyl transferase [Patulibacter medicamentivorans]